MFARPSPRRPRSAARIRHQAREGQRLDYVMSCNTEKTAQAVLNNVEKYNKNYSVPKVQNTTPECTVATVYGSRWLKYLPHATIIAVFLLL